MSTLFQGYEICGMRIRSPIIAGSGLVTDSARNIRHYLAHGAGAVITKTIHPAPPVGNSEKVTAISTGWLNSTTYSKKTVEHWLGLLKIFASEDAPVIASIHARTPSELGHLAREVEGTGCKSLELGISCLNEFEGLFDTPERVANYTREVKNAVSIPFSVKLSLGDFLMERIEAAVSEGASCITLSDTIPGARIDIATARPLLGGPFGYSGPGIMPLVIAAIYELRAGGGTVPVMASGGVSEASDALEYLYAGANAVQVYSALHTSRDAIAPIVDDLFHMVGSEHSRKVIGKSILTREISL
ncbi:dihydroorotate dehydrogenase (fumarate)/dihydroorotate dehydrogenase (NAD+) catalytic subunit [Neorhizobium sp. 2083]|uniref:dihydroorotate dehydrogenase n=1 Tax=Neorhizobium sp. 2083 TaxID=2817762 RepID=UPI00285FE7AD|nr:hypothetical protein [Neorhizobium sp. 2083]MDR6819953.1 dihydroorotate dehydrogenase (fumarate)/dihydroorotate dehydrogenase (NAD+) catalytic subunit [Neorhizobium sp. 2083]